MNFQDAVEQKTKEATDGTVTLASSSFPPTLTPPPHHLTASARHVGATHAAEAIHKSGCRATLKAHQARVGNTLFMTEPVITGIKVASEMFKSTRSGGGHE